jgi:hypothetical protein
MLINRFLKFLFLFFLISQKLNAQKIEFGIGAGVSNYKGDISPRFNPKQLGGGANVLFRYNLSRSVSLKSSITYLTYNAADSKTNDAFYIQRNLTAKGNVFELSATAEYNFLDKAKMVKSKDISPYLFGGIGVAMVSNKSSLTTNTQKFVTPVIPYGVGVKYRFKGPLSVCAEFGTRFTLSDNFDLNGSALGKTNVSGTDANTSRLQYGDLTRKDQYYFTNLTLTYTIFSLVCPD